MTSVTVYHDRNPAVVVHTIDDLDHLLDQIAADPRYVEFPVFASIESADRRLVLQIGLGRPDLSTLVWYDAEMDIAASTGTIAYAHRPRFTFGGTPTDMYDHSAVPVDTARQAAREFFTTGTRPTCLQWQEPRYSPAGEADST